MSTKVKKQSFVSRAKSYNRALQEAYHYGYRDGYAAHEHLPNVRGARTAAQYGVRPRAFRA